MKKCLVLAVTFAAIFATSCAKQEKIDPKETLVQDFEQFCQGESESSLANFQERFAAYEESDFSEEQRERLENAANKVGICLFVTYKLDPNYKEVLKELEREYLDSIE